MFKPRPLRRPGAARRAAILKAAAAVFLEQGYERTSLSQITSRAGGSKTLIYDQFGDKAGLFRAVMTELCATMFAPLAGDLPVDRAPVQVLSELGRQFLHSLFGEDVRALTRIVFTEGPRHPDIADLFFSYGYDAGFAQLGLSRAPRGKLRGHAGGDAASARSGIVSSSVALQNLPS